MWRMCRKKIRKMGGNQWIFNIMIHHLGDAFHLDKPTNPCHIISYHFWLVVWNMNFIFPYIGNVIIPTDEFIFFRGVGQPPTRFYILSVLSQLYPHGGWFKGVCFDVCADYPIAMEDHPVWTWSMSFIDNVWPQNDTTAAILEKIGGNIIYNIVETLFKDPSFGAVYKKLPNRSIPHISLWISSVY